MHRVSTVALILLALIVLGGAGYVISHNNDAPGGQPSGGSPSRTAVASPGPSSAASASTSPSPAQRTAAFLGDDWTAGVGASSRAKRFTTLLSRALGLRERNLGKDGSGYAAESTSKSAYSSRIDKLVAAKPQIVVVSGGRNDVVHDEVTPAATNAAKIFQLLHRKLPDATLVAIAPMWGDSAPPGTLVELGTAIKKAVSDVGGTYLDIADPIRGHTNFMATSSDPADSGYAAIAGALEPKLRPLLPR